MLDCAWPKTRVIHTDNQGLAAARNNGVRKAAYFGIRDGRWLLPDYSPEQLLRQNVIFCSALFRREHWEKVGGYNINMVYGWEDWDFWLSLIRLGMKVYRTPS
jgi:N-terminal domain of galactosyltransferase